MVKERISPIDTGIIILVLITAGVHFSLNVIMGHFSPLFTLNGIGYLGLLGLLFLPLPVARDHRKLLRLALLAFVVVTIVSWLAIGDKSWWVGIADKFLEVVLVVLLAMKRP